MDFIWHLTSGGAASAILLLAFFCLGCKYIFQKILPENLKNTCVTVLFPLVTFFFFSESWKAIKQFSDEIEKRVKTDLAQLPKKWSDRHQTPLFLPPIDREICASFLGLGRRWWPHMKSPRSLEESLRPRQHIKKAVNLLLCQQRST